MKLPDFCAAVFFILMSCAAQAETLPRIAVLPFDSGLSAAYADMTAALPDIVTACFTSHANTAEVIERVQLDALTGETTLNMAMQPVHYKSANYLLRGSIFPHKEGIGINLMLYTLGAGRLAASSAAMGMASDIHAVTCRAVDELSQRLPATLETAGEDVTPAAAEKNRNMAEALGFYLGGAYERAIGAFLKLVRQDSADAEAQYFLAKSYAGAGMNDAARVEFIKLVERFPDTPHRAEAEAFLAPAKGEKP